MKQYYEIKKQYSDCMLFYRMGDFYELFLEDAYVGAKILDITLTGKSNGKNDRIPMAGVPYHAIDSYLNKLVKAGYKVAICEQVSLPNKTGLVDREVVRIVTPGTVLDEKSLEKSENNHIVSILCTDDALSVCAADISTGMFQVLEINAPNPELALLDELSRLKPSECLLPPDMYNNPDILKILKVEKQMNIYCYQEWDTYADTAKEYLKEHFGIQSLVGFGLDEKYLAQKTAAVLLSYLKNTQKGQVAHIKNITTVHTNEYVQLDRATIINLELFSTIREHDTKGSLLSVLDQTQTAMGARLLKQWLRKPLTQREHIEDRYDAVDELGNNHEKKQQLQEQLKMIADIERMLSRLSVGIGNARDLINLRASLCVILSVKKSLHASTSPLLSQIYTTIADETAEIAEFISTYIKDEPALDIKNGGIIKNGVDTQLDTLHKKVAVSKEWITELEETERKRTGINSLKVRYNKVFGFYIEVSKANAHLVPDSYYRKQTLVNGERFVTPELKEQEEIILTAQEKINVIEYELFQQVLQKVITHISLLLETAQQIAILDCLVSFAQLAEKRNYVRPTLLYSGEIRIKDGRHPVVEQLLDKDQQFVSNDVILDNISQQLLLITGPNMAGKSVFIRQVALIVLMAQIGCFVPAQKAHISVCDKIFVRSGASDVITSGLSTFMVEMVETAHILNHATKNSLIVMDEIGRGTSTYDGISIAWAVAEYLVSLGKDTPKTLFATHYHELQTLEQEHPTHIKNYHMAVIEENDVPIFLHSLLPGGASSSFGIAVAKLAGVPEVVIARAKELLQTLEERKLDNSLQKNAINMPEQKYLETYSNTTLFEHMIAKELNETDIHQMTPLEALNKLADMKNKLKLMQSQDKPFLEVD